MFYHILYTKSCYSITIKWSVSVVIWDNTKARQIHQVSAEGISTNLDKVKEILNWPFPKSANQVRSFCGLVLYYKRFIPGFSEIGKTLYRLSKKNRKLSWTEECQQAFDTLTEKFTTAPVLT